MGQLTSNAIAFAAFRNSGGMTKCLWLNALYAAAVIGFSLLFAVSGDDIRQVFSGLPRFLLAMQYLGLGGFSTLAILTTIQRDNTTKMMESHRLMPIPPRLAALGYMVGPSLILWPAVLFNLFIGGICTGLSDHPLSWWLLANFSIVSVCMFAWALAVAGGFMGGLAGILLLVPLGITAITGGQASYIMLPMAMLNSPMLGKTIFQVSSPASDLLLATVLAAVLQFALGMVAIQAAARRFSATEASMFTPLLAILMVGLLAAAGIAINCMPDQLPQYIFRRGIEAPTHVGSVIFLMIAGMLPMASLGSAERLASPADRRWSTDIATVALMALCGAAYAGFACGTSVNNTHVASATFWVFYELFFAWAWTLLCSRLSHRWGLGLVGVFVAAILIHVIPAAASLAFATHQGLSPFGKFIIQISPMGFIPTIWNEGVHETNPLSAAIQAILLAIPVTLLIRHRRGVFAKMLKPQ